MMKRFFTLIELLAVVAIIAILAAMTLGLIGYANRIAKEKKTTATMSKIEAVLDAYKHDRGGYPVVNSATAPFPQIWSDVFNQNDKNGKPRYQVSDPGNTSPLLPGMADYKAFQDGWKQSFLYRCPGTHNTTSYDLWSMGDDGIDDSGTATYGDDINNWTRR